ncbi:GGDEF domain-containing protein [Nocardia sp. NPDC049149]|uniref:GGDEF domain-containing protein n=1 Tax=Nocardia sp. NPDC049149 TaxID=3364315 RepID=UPI003716A80B
MLRSWWSERIDYRWLVDTIGAHSALRPLKIMVGCAGLVMLAITIVALCSPAGQHGTAGEIQGGIVATTAVLWTLRWWLLPWPGEAESLVLIAMVDIAITANNVMVQDRLLGAMGSALLVVTGGYVTIFHGPRFLLWHVGWSLLSIVVLSLMMVLGNGHGAGDVALGVVVVLVSFVVDIFVLPIVQFCHWVLRRDALTDPLTGLMNRRGLDYHMQRHVDCSDSRRRFSRRRETRACYFATVDLDRFKTVNDTFGHAVGDDVLVSTAQRLRATVDPDALVARTGGEEFALVGHLLDPADEIGERLRAAIATMPNLPVEVTASVGVALWDGTRMDPQCTEPAGRHLLQLSDDAMYVAKRLGGNTVIVTSANEPGTPTSHGVPTGEWWG